jgi:hypothetical protein
MKIVPNIRLLVVAILLSAYGSASSADRELRGRIIDAESGKPVKAARVVVFLDNLDIGKHFETDKGGNFAGSLAPTASPISTPTEIVVWHDDYQSQRFTHFTTNASTASLGPSLILTISTLTLAPITLTPIAGEAATDQLSDAALIRRLIGTEALTDVAAKATVIEALAQRRVHKAVPALINCLSDDRPVGSREDTIRTRAAAALERITDKRLGTNEMAWRRWQAGGK